jgi:hypothetical protein
MVSILLKVVLQYIHYISTALGPKNREKRMYKACQIRVSYFKCILLYFCDVISGATRKIEVHTDVDHKMWKLKFFRHLTSSGLHVNYCSFNEIDCTSHAQDVM